MDKLSALPSLQRFLIATAVMAATMMEVLDTTIVNVALPYMQGSLGANSDQISWTVTCYVIASGVVMPLTGFFSDQFGQKQWLLASLIGFTVSSALCGLANSLNQIVLLRLLQGALGGALVPLSQSIMANLYPGEKRGNAMAFWGMGIMIGPILGPCLGGYFTEVFNWRWSFYINIPVGAAAAYLAFAKLPKTPKQPRALDWRGFTTMGLGIAGVQYLLDRGTQQDWFSALDIRIAATVSVVALSLFIIDHWRRQPKNPIVKLSLFKDRNFTIASLLVGVTRLGLYGVVVLQPLLLERLLGYPPFKAGLVMAPRGLSAMLSMLIVGQLIRVIDVRWLVTIGIGLTILSQYFMTYYSFVTNDFWQTWPTLIQGFGLGFTFTPLATTAYSTLPKAVYTEAAGLFSLIRTVGSSIGISLTMTFFTRHSQLSWNHLVGFISPYHHALRHYLTGLGISPNSPKGGAILGHMLYHQALMASVISTFAFIGYCFALILPLIWLLNPLKSAHRPSN